MGTGNDENPEGDSSIEDLLTKEGRLSQMAELEAKNEQLERNNQTLTTSLEQTQEELKSTEIDRDAAIALFANERKAREDTLKEQVELGLQTERIQEEFGALHRRLQEAEFKEQLNQSLDDIKEAHQRQYLDVAVQQMIGLLGDVLNIDGVAAAYVDENNELKITYKGFERVKDTIIQEKEQFLSKASFDHQTAGRIFNECYNRALSKFLHDTSKEIQLEDTDFERPDKILAEMKEEDWNGFLEREEEEKQKDELTELIYNHLKSEMEFVGHPLNIEGREGNIGALVVYRKKGLDDVEYKGSMERGSDIEELFLRITPIDNPFYKQLLHVASEEIDDFIATLIDNRLIIRFAKELEEILYGAGFVSEVAQEVQDKTVECARDVAGHILVFHDDETSRDESSLELRLRLTADSSITKPEIYSELKDSAKVLMSDEESVKEFFEELGIKNYKSVDIKYGDEFVGRVYAIVEDREVNHFEERVLDLLASNIGNKLTAQYKKIRELRFSFSPGTSRRIIEEKVDLDTLREEEISVFYADICNFTGMSKQIGPEDTTKIMNLFGTEMRKIIDEYDAMFDKVIGDCIMGHVGPPFYKTSMEERANAAVEIAIRMNERVEELNKEYLQNLQYLHDNNFRAESIAYLHFHPLQISVGIASGPASIGKIEAGPAFDFTAIGDAVNISNRILTEAAKDQILVCPQTFKYLTGKKDVPLYGADVPTKNKKYLLNAAGDPRELKNIKVAQRLYSVRRSK
jgi:class 3 adenylate cyclase